MAGLLQHIYMAPTSGAAMLAASSASLEAGRGIVGDRYYEGTGNFSAKLRDRGDDDWQITLIEAEEIDAFLGAETLHIDYGDFRRNLVTSRVRLNPLVGKRFAVDGIVMEGVRLCEPCAYLSGLLTDKLIPAMVGRCGLRARILDSGQIRVGGSINA